MAKNTVEPGPRIEALLDQEIDGARRLLEALTQEHESLQQRDIESIERAVSAKQQWVTQLEALGKQFKQQVGDDAAQVVETLTRLDPAGTRGLLERWNRLCALADDCQRQNQVNGRIIESGRVQAERILTILSGQLQRQEVYGPNGQTSGGGRGHTLAKV
jgi:flagella synthesis protein FlgN